MPCFLCISCQRISANWPISFRFHKFSKLLSFYMFTSDDVEHLQVILSQPRLQLPCVLNKGPVQNFREICSEGVSNLIKFSFSELQVHFLHIYLLLLVLIYIRKQGFVRKNYNLTLSFQNNHINQTNNFLTVSLMLY